MKRTRKLIIGFWCAVALLAALGASPLWPYARSLAVMEVSSGLASRDSVMEAGSFTLELPEISGWYPKVCTFCDDENFSLYIGEDAKLTILYCFPAFDLKTGSSVIFDPENPLYSSFYGAYAVSLASGEPYGFREGESLEAAAAAVARYDYGNLVLRDFGLQWREQTFESSSAVVRSGVSCAGSDDWAIVDAQLLTNGLDHERKVFTRTYLQYGAPPGKCTAPFAPLTLECSIAVRFYPEYNAAVYLYAMSPDRAVTDNCMERLMEKTVIAAK